MFLVRSLKSADDMTELMCKLKDILAPISPCGFEMNNVLVIASFFKKNNGSGGGVTDNDWSPLFGTSFFEQ